MKLDSQVSRAELLRALQACDYNKADFAAMADLLGFQASNDYWQRVLLPEPVAEQEPDNAPQDSGQTEPAVKTLLQPPEPRPQVNYYCLAHRERYASEATAASDQPELFAGVEPLEDEALHGFWEAQPPLNPDKLSHPARMAPVIRKGLLQEVGRRLALNTLVRQIARQTPLRRFPIEPRLLPAGRVTVIADFNQRLLPFWEDMREACELIRQKHGKIGLDMRVLAKDEPLADYYAFADWLKRDLTVQPWDKVPPHSAVFILSDLGQLAAKDSLIRKRWRYFVTQLNRRGIKPWVLAPIAAERQSPQLQANTQLLLWQRYGRLKKQASQGDNARHAAQVTRLLSFMSLSPHIEPELLRSWCELLPSDAGSSGVEAAVYLHPDVHWGYTSITLKSERRAYYQQQFQQLDETLKQQVFKIIQRHHSPQFPAVWAEAILNAESLMRVDSALLAKAETLMLRFAKRYYQESAHEGMQLFARRHIQRLKPAQRAAKPYASALYALAHRQALASGQPLTDWCDSRIANQVLKQPAQRRSCYVYQIGAQLWLTQQAQTQGQCLAEFVSYQNTLWVNGQAVSLLALTPRPPLPQGEGEKMALSFSPSPSGRGVGVRANNVTLTLDTGQERLTLATLQKPTWASELSLRDGKLVASLPFAGQDYRLEPFWQDERLAWRTLQNEQVVGFDDYGLYADLTIKGVKQRLRYIEPTTFMMGSPEDEAGRDDDEDWHQVTLTQGYWLADTACTQALWQAVMGDNPAEFKDDAQNPVETVSWLDVQQFIATLNKLNPALGVHLPSEAQWENACRAGTDTPFNFEGEISLDKVNYSGLWNDSGFADAVKQKTVSVKSYAPNAWGLYEMHGNVWEWCFDEWREKLGNAPVVDPVTVRFKSGVQPDNSGQQAVTAKTARAFGYATTYDSSLLENGEDSGVLRVLRGGSWDNSGSYCRSAIRRRSTADGRYGLIGFRFAVGHELPHGAVFDPHPPAASTRRFAPEGEGEFRCAIV